MRDEQSVIVDFFQKMKNGEDMTESIIYIDMHHKRSVILQYYIGSYLERLNNWNEAEKRFIWCIENVPTFVPPYFNLGNAWNNSARYKDVIKLMSKVFDKPTLDASMYPVQNKYNLVEQLRISSILFKAYSNCSSVKNDIIIDKYLTIISKLRKKNVQLEYVHIETWKNLCFGLGNIYIQYDAQKAFDIYKEGYEIGGNVLWESIEQNAMIRTLNKSLYQGLSIASNYILDARIERRILMTSKLPIRVSSGRIKLGYFSPDFNKNAVGLFITSLLKYYDHEKYDVFCFYNTDASDEYTELFRTYIDTDKWFNVASMTDMEVFKLINDDLCIDILVDLIGLGIGNRSEMIEKRPAPIVINYLGFPDYTYMHTHRIVDKITDPYNICNGEKLLRMPRCFICYTLFENVSLPNIRIRPSDDKVHLCVLQRTLKHHPIIRAVWKRIMKNKRFILYIKAGAGQDTNLLQDEYPYAKIMQFTNDLSSYLDQLNEIDVCLDTYPYSGTTTTCSSLLMGVPVFTYYSENNRHVSNVTASILKTCNEDESYICNSLEEYETRVSNYVPDQKRQERRNRFLSAMEPKRFMKEYEAILLTIKEEQGHSS